MAGVKKLNRDLDVIGSIKINGTVVIDSSGNIDAPVTTTNATFSGNTTLGDGSADTVTINGTTTASAPVTVGVNDTGYDVKFFGATTGKSWLWDESADKMIVTGDAQVTGTTTLAATTIGGAAASVTLAGATTIAANKSISSAVAGELTAFRPAAVQQALSGAGAVNLTTFYTAVTNTGSDALTLADSTVPGQLKKVKMIVDPGTDSTLTFNTNATIVFADVGDYAVLMWNGSDWIPVELGNDADGATAPVYTPAA